MPPAAAVTDGPATRRRWPPTPAPRSRRLPRSSADASPGDHHHVTTTDDDDHHDHAAATTTTPPAAPVPVDPPPEDGTVEPGRGRPDRDPALGLARTIYEGIGLSTLDNGPGTGRARRCPARSATSSWPATGSSHNADFRYLDRLARRRGDLRRCGRPPRLPGDGHRDRPPDAIWIVDQTYAHRHAVRLPPAGLGPRSASSSTSS